MRAPNVTDSQHLRCKCEEKSLWEAEKRDTTPLSSPSPDLIGGLTGQSSNHRPGALDCIEIGCFRFRQFKCRSRQARLRVKPGNDTAEKADSHLFGFLAPFVALAFMGIEQSFTQADRFWRYFDQFVVLDVGERFLKRHADRRSQAHRFVLRGGAD